MFILKLPVVKFLNSGETAYTYVKIKYPCCGHREKYTDLSRFLKLEKFFLKAVLSCYYLQLNQ